MQHLEKQQQIDTNAMTSKDIQINRLENLLKMAEDKEFDLSEQNDKQQQQIVDLQNDNAASQDAIKLRVMELKHKTQSIDILEKRIKENNEKVFLGCFFIP